MANFSNIENIRLITKLPDTANFQDTSIQHFQDQVTAKMNGYLKQRFYFDSNTLPDNFTDSDAEIILQGLEERLTKAEINIHFNKTQANRFEENDNSDVKQKEAVIDELKELAMGNIALYDSNGDEYPQKSNSFYRPRGYPINDDDRAFKENKTY